MLSWFRKRRRERLLAEPFPPRWREFLEQNVHHFHCLDPKLRDRLCDWLRIFIAEKQWVGCGGLEVTDEMRVTIAAQAGILVMGIPQEYHFEGIKSILVYPTAFMKPPEWTYQTGLVNPDQITLGEAWHRGPIVLSWQDALHGGTVHGDGRNLVFHEFAHHLDGLDGGTDGVPPLGSRAEVRRWREVANREYHRLVAAAQRGQRTLLDWYGATNEAEFFAVATECFFEKPRQLAERHPEFYDVMRGFYRQDPATWEQPASRARATQRVKDSRHGQKGRRAKNNKKMARPPASQMRESPDATAINPHSADGAFTRGVLHLHRGRLDLALAEFSEALEIAPDDAEARYHRGEVLIELGRADEALADCEKAVRLDPSDAEAYRMRGRARLHLDRYEEALADFGRVIDAHDCDAEAYFERGLAYRGLGKHKQAIADYTRAIRGNATWAEAFLVRGESYEALGETAKAKADFDKAHGLDPTLVREPA